MIFAKSRLQKKMKINSRCIPASYRTGLSTFRSEEHRDLHSFPTRRSSDLIVSNGTIDFQRIVKEIAQASSFTPADIEGVQLAIENKISEYLISGYHVQLGDLGYFSAKLKARPVMDAKEIHAQSIYFDNVNFRPSSSFRKKVRGFVEKAKSGFAHSAEIPVEERRRRLEKFLDERPMIRRKEYTQLTGLLKNKALNELNGWVKEGVLDTIGSGSHIIYVRANTGKD